uniref:CEP170 C-terminal domain-containing protein n=1 Tax=Neogobius melanostomus TaxID=47308 RepID=A0A8C6SJX0_9GOBI
MGSHLLITSVSQLSTKIRQSVDKTAGKIRILFKDKDRNWEEIESKLKSESEVPVLKSSNKEFSAILLELKRVEKQLQVINVMVDPDGTLDALASLGLTSPTTPTKSQSAKIATSSAVSPGLQPAAKETLPEIYPGPGTMTASTRVKCASAKSEETVRLRPNGEEAIAQK